MVNQNTFRACKIKLIRISSNDWSLYKQMSCRDRTSLIFVYAGATFSDSCNKRNFYFLPKGNQKYFHRVKYTNCVSIYFCYTLCNLNYNFIYSGQKAMRMN